MDKNLRSTESNFEEKYGIKVEDCDEDLVTEENNEKSVEVVKDKQLKLCVSDPIHPVNVIAGELIQSSTLPVSTGNVTISNSENIQFGHNTHFHGPVTIIQNKNAYDNGSYIKTDDEQSSSKEVHEANNLFNAKVIFQRWHKVIFTAIFFLCVGVLAAIIISLQKKKEPSNKSQDLSTGIFSDPAVNENSPLRMVSRVTWLAQPPSGVVDKIHQPVPWVIIAHTASQSCSYQGKCVLLTRSIQMYHIESQMWSDIGYNFLVGGDGAAYEGRGWDSIGAHTKGYNVHSIGIAFIGTFVTVSPPQRQFEACKKLLKHGVQLGKLAKDYKIFAHGQLQSSLSPGKMVYDVIKEWPGFVKNVTSDALVLP